MAYFMENNMQNPVLKNVESGQIIELVKSPFSIGRGLASDYVIENKIVSRIHCSLTKTDEGWTLTDSSTNGTLVNEGHYKGESSPILKHDDEISLGYKSYTYRFITEVEKAPNCQVDKLKSQELNGNPSVLNGPRSPGTPNSFDENGISDELLNNLADNMLSTVGESTNIAEPQADNPDKNLEKPTASKTELTSHQSEQVTSTTEATVNPPTVTSTLETLYKMASVELNTEGSKLGKDMNTANTNDNVPEQVTSRNEELNNQNTDYDTPTQSASNSSVNTIIYSLPDEIVPEVPQPLIDYKAEASNIDVEQNAAQGSVASTNEGSTGANTTAKPLLAESIEAVTEGHSKNVSSSSTSTAGPSAVSGTNTAAKPRDLLAESIDAVARGHSNSNVTSSFTSTADPSAQCPSRAASTANTASSTSAPAVPTTVTMASPLNANKKVKVMAVSSGAINQLRPATGQALTAYTIGTGDRAPVVRQLSRNEMQRILANQPKMPIVILDKFPTGSAPSIPATNIARTSNAGSHTAPRNTRVGIATVTTSTHVTTTAANSTNSPGRITILEGMRRSIHNTKLPASTRKGIKRAVQNYEKYNPGVSTTTTTTTTTTGSSTVSISGNTLLQSADNQNTTTTGVSRVMSMNTRLQTATNQVPTVTTTGISRIILGNTWQQTANNPTATAGNNLFVSGNTLQQSAQNQNTTTTGISRIILGNTWLQTANNTNTSAGNTNTNAALQTSNIQTSTAGATRLAPGHYTLQSANNHALTTGNIISSTHNTTLVPGNTLLQTTENQNCTTIINKTVLGNTRPQISNNQNTTAGATRLAPGIYTLQTANNHALTTGNIISSTYNTTLVPGNTLLQTAENQNCTTINNKTVLGNTRPQTSNNQNTTAGATRLAPGIYTLHTANNHAVTTGNIISSTNNTTLVPGNMLLQTSENQNATTSISRTVSGNTRPQTSNNQNTTAGSTTEALWLTMSQMHAVATTNVTRDLIDDKTVPVAVQEVVIDHTGSATGAATNQAVPSIQCHDSQEPGTSKAPVKSKSDIEKQKDQNHYEEMESELMCTICANLFIKAVTLGCSHSFCQYCIGEWKKKKTDCPICRNKMTSTTRTLVLDNIIEKMIETASEVDKEDRKSAIEERKRIEDAETAKKQQQNAINKHIATRGRLRGRRGRGGANARVNQPDVVVTAPVITIPDSPSTTDGDDSDNSNTSRHGYDYDDYYSDEWYGRPRGYYGGYGSCFTCGERGHWANGCPNR